VELEGAARLQLEQEVTALRIDQECGLSFCESGQNIEMAAKARLRTMPITTTQITIFTNLLFCILVE
jgi:hypothetical protein